MKLIIDIEDEALERLSTADPNLLYTAIKNGKPYEERPQGKWKEYKLRNDIVVEYAFKCSNCKKDSGLLYRTDFCPNCGAKMKDGAEE